MYVAYGGDAFAYDFSKVLALSKARKPDTLDESAKADRLYFSSLRRKDARGRDVGPAPMPTGDQLRRHALRFGPEMVNETAKSLGIDMRVASSGPRPKRMRRTGPDLKAQVLELHGRGVVATAIADTLNVADRRVKEILAVAAAA